uniref:Uncharacterized protein n=1 Tax=Anguilla anguilla TaxID=7936 RepID=A0A0E9VEM8_ANGAN
MLCKEMSVRRMPVL